MWPSSHSVRSRTSSTWTRRRAPAGRRARAARRARSAASPGASSSCRRAGSRRALRRPTDSASRAARRPSSSSRPTKTISRSGSPSHASLEPKPAVSIGLQTAPPMCASSNCWSVRTSTSSAPPARFCSTWRGASGSTSTPSVSSSPRLSATIASKFGGCGPRPASAASTKRVLVVDRQRRVVGALEADRRGDLHVHPRAAAHRAAEVAGPDLALGGQRQQLVAQRAVDPARALGLLDREVGARDVVDEQRVARQHRPRLVAAGGVDRARTRCARGGGPACAARARRSAPSASSQPSSNGSWS